jgi:outer membrane autotransporter protein
MNNWFTEALASYGITNVKNSENRLTSSGMEIASAKYKSQSYSGQILGGYNYQCSNDVMLSPVAGLRYSTFNDSAYTETGTRFQNLTVNKRSYNNFEGILGLRTGKTFDVREVVLMPEIHGYVNYNFKGKSPLTEATLDGIDTPLPNVQPKTTKTFFTVGTSLTAKHNRMEYGIAYNATMANKYLAQQGSIKLRINL